VVTSGDLTKMAVTSFAIAENRIRHGNFTAVSSIERELLRVEILHGDRGNFALFLLLLP